MRATRSDAFAAKFFIHAIPNKHDIKNGFKSRKVFVEPYIFNNDYSSNLGYLKDEVVAYFTESSMVFEYPGSFFSYKNSK